MTIREFINRVRTDGISDDKSPYRWEDTVIGRHTNNGIRELYSTHPESLYVSTVVTSLPDEIDVANDTQDLPVNDFFINALFHWVCHGVLSADSEDADNLVLANDHYKKYAVEMM